MILSECEVLEDLKIRKPPIELNDIVASPWASCRLKRLELRLNVSTSPSDSPTQYIPYYLRTPPDQPSVDDHRVFAQINTFYRQIGKQKDMTELFLYWINPMSPQSDYLHFIPTLYPLPGMLALENKNNAGARPGFLQLLGGLTKLTRLGGHIYPETPNQKIADDALEADWIAEHWPLLGHHDFLPYSGPKGAKLRRTMRKETVGKESGIKRDEADEEMDGTKDDDSS
jgi:hypothetical protein